MRWCSTNVHDRHRRRREPASTTSTTRRGSAVQDRRAPTAHLIRYPPVASRSTTAIDSSRTTSQHILIRRRTCTSITVSSMGDKSKDAEENRQVTSGTRRPARRSWSSTTAPSINQACPSARHRWRYQRRLGSSRLSSRARLSTQAPVAQRKSDGHPLVGGRPPGAPLTLQAFLTVPDSADLATPGGRCRRVSGGSAHKPSRGGGSQPNSTTRSATERGVIQRSMHPGRIRRIRPAAAGAECWNVSVAWCRFRRRS